MSMESFPQASAPKKATTEAPIVKISKTEANPDDFEEQMSAEEAGKTVTELSIAERNFGDEDFTDLEGALDTLHLSNEERAAKEEKEHRALENSMQEEADDLTSDILRMQITEGIPEAQAINKAIIDMCTKLQAEGVSPDNAGGRAMHAFARHLESTAGYKKDDPENKAKLARMQDIINKIMGTNALGLGQEKVTRGGDVQSDITRIVGAETVTDKQDVAFKGPDVGKTDQAPAMFSLADLMRQAQEPPKPRNKPRGQA